MLLSYKTKKAPFGTPNLRPATCHLKLSLTCLNSSRLQPVLIYHQFASAAATTFANVKSIPAFTTGGQHGVIAEDRFPNRAGAQEGTPSSKKSLSLILANTCIRGPLFQKLLILTNYLYWGAPSSRKALYVKRLPSAVPCCGIRVA